MGIGGAFYGKADSDEERFKVSDPDSLGVHFLIVFRFYQGLGSRLRPRWTPH